MQLNEIIPVLEMLAAREENEMVDVAEHAELGKTKISFRGKTILLYQHDDGESVSELITNLFCVAADLYSELKDRYQVTQSLVTHLLGARKTATSKWLDELACHLNQVGDTFYGEKGKLSAKRYRDRLVVTDREEMPSST